MGDQVGERSGEPQWRGPRDRQSLVIPIAPFNGTNPVAKFGATVSCLTKDGVVNVSTGLFPANSEGNSTINGMVALPKHCKDPLVFVVSPGGAWFAMSNTEDED